MSTVTWELSGFPVTLLGTRCSHRTNSMSNIHSYQGCVISTTCWLQWADSWSKTTLWNSVHLNIYIQHVLHSAKSSSHLQTQDWNCNGIHGNVISKNSRESIWIHPPQVKSMHQSRKWHHLYWSHHVPAGATSYLCLVCQSLKLSCRIYSNGGY